MGAGMPGKYYLVAGLERRGPYTREELEAQILRRSARVWFKGLPDWVAAGQVSELLGIFEEPPPVPGSERAAAPREERPPIPERAAEPPEERPPTLDRDVSLSSEQFKDPDVTLPRAEIPSPTYRDEADDLPRPIALARVPYDVVGMRRLFLGGILTYLPGLVLILMVGVSIALLGLYGFDSQVPRFDPQRTEIVHVFDPGARSAGTLASIISVAAAVLGVIGLASGAACFFVLMYRAWRITEDGRTRPTPGRAVGLLFVPFFNVYWVWVGIWGLARNLNRFVRRYDL